MSGSEDHRLTWRSSGVWAMISIHAGALLALLPAARPTPAILAFAFATYAVRNFCISAGFHRYFSHHAFTTSRLVQFLFAFVGGMGVMHSALWWAAHHRRHHRFADHDGDPHSPREGFLWSHLLWFMARGAQPTDYARVREFEKFPELVWLDRREWVPLVVFIAFCFLVGGFPGWVWGANVSTVALCHSTFAINSLSHRYGSRRYDLPDTSTNNLGVALVSFGEGWHNNHHQWPSRARLGETPLEIDISWYGIVLMEKLGLIGNVVRRGE